jgi:uncharacterized protein
MAMRTKLLLDAGRGRTIAVVLEVGDECMECLKTFAEQQNIRAAQITGIGAFSSADLGFCDWERKEYLPIEIRERVEVASLIGDIAAGRDTRSAVHVHAVPSNRKASRV